MDDVALRAGYCLVCRTPYLGGLGEWKGRWVGQRVGGSKGGWVAFFSGFWEAWTPPPLGGGGGILLGAGFSSLGTQGS